MAAKRPIDGYPTSWGSNRVAVFGHAGPASYTQVTALAGTVPISAGGDTVQAVEAGMKYLDFLVALDESDDGAFTVEAIPNSVTSLTGAPGTPNKSFHLRWISRVTALVGGQNQTAGSEAVAATNLSGETIRLLAVGPK
jgi:hypothetical protein